MLILVDKRVSSIDIQKDMFFRLFHKQPDEIVCCHTASFARLDKNMRETQQQKKTKMRKTAKLIGKKS